MRRLVDTYGIVRFSRNPIFTTLVRAVISQQLSEKAAATIYGRLQDRADISPEALWRLDPDALRECGISRTKADSIRAIARAALDGDLEQIKKLPYDDVLQHLLKIRGVGRWTAQIVLIFGLGRRDVWPHDDVRLLRAAGNLYGIRTPDEFIALGERFRPYRSHAAWYLWRSLSSKKTA
jgi:DNA-3-methyladenine glycosylase II